MVGFIVECIGFIIYWLVADWAFDYTAIEGHGKRFWFLLLSPIVMRAFLNLVATL